MLNKRDYYLDNSGIDNNDNEVIFKFLQNKITNFNELFDPTTISEIVAETNYIEDDVRICLKNIGNILLKLSESEI